MQKKTKRVSIQNSNVTKHHNKRTTKNVTLMTNNYSTQFKPNKLQTRHTNNKTNLSVVHAAIDVHEHESIHITHVLQVLFDTLYLVLYFSLCLSSNRGKSVTRLLEKGDY